MGNVVVRMLEKGIGIKTKEDWFSVQYEDITRVFGLSIKQPLHKLLSQVYPDYDWPPWKFRRVYFEGI